VPENTKPGVVVVHIEAEDCDDGGGLKFSLTTATLYFHLNELSGELRTTKYNLDREKKRQHILEVMVSDSGTPMFNSTSYVTIKVSDVNDNIPSFLNTGGRFSIPELIEFQEDEPDMNENELLQGAGKEDLEDSLKWSDWNTMDGYYKDGWKRLFRVIASDLDEGRNGSLRYKLKFPVSTTVEETRRADEQFTIHATTGEIYTSASGLRSDRTLKFIVEATDNGIPVARRAETVVSLFVKPVNRNPSEPPIIFHSIDHSITLTTKEKPGYIVETIDAEDPDGDALWYEIVSGDPSQYFFINPDSQNLILAKLIPSGSEFSLNISVTDGYNVVFTQVYQKRSL